MVALPGEPDPDAKGLLGGQASAQNNGVGVRPGLLGDVLMSGASPGNNAMVVPVLMGSYSEPKQAAPSWGLAPLPWPPCPGASHSMGVHLVDHRVRWEEELGVPACGRGPPWAGDGEGGTEAPLPGASASPCVEGGGGHGLTVRPVPSGADGAGRGAPPLGRPVPAGPRRPAPRPAATALLPAAPSAAARAPVPTAAGRPGPGAAEERPAGGELLVGGGRGMTLRAPRRGRGRRVRRQRRRMAGAGGQGGPPGAGSGRLPPDLEELTAGKAQRCAEPCRGRVQGATGKPRQERQPAGLGKFASAAEEAPGPPADS